MSYVKKENSPIENASKKPQLTNFVAVNLVFLLASTWILSETTFNKSQIILEICLITLLGFLAAKSRYTPFEILILFVNLVVLSSAFIYLGPREPVILAKNTILAILIYLVFSRYELKAKPIYLLAFVCAALICVQIFGSGRFPFEISEYLIKPAVLMDSRPLGLFLSEHGSAAFLAVVFFGYTFKKHLWFFDLFLLFKTGVATPFLTILVAKFIRWCKPISLLCERSASIAVIGFLTTFLILYQLRDIFLWLLHSINKDIAFSAEIILEQMFEPDYYLNFLQFMPGNIKALENTVGIPEVGFTKYSMDFGGIFLFTFLLLLLNRLSHWRPFILLSLFHITIIHVPIIIYVFFLFQSKQNQQ